MVKVKVDMVIKYCRYGIYKETNKIGHKKCQQSFVTVINNRKKKSNSAKVQI